MNNKIILLVLLILILFYIIKLGKENFYNVDTQIDRLKYDIKQFQEDIEEKKKLKKENNQNYEVIKQDIENLEIMIKERNNIIKRIEGALKLVSNEKLTPEQEKQKVKLQNKFMKKKILEIEKNKDKNIKEQITSQSEKLSQINKL